MNSGVPIAKYSLVGDDNDDFWGTACEAVGLFTPLDHIGLRRLDLRGCKPEGRLRASAERVGTKRAAAGNVSLSLLNLAGEPIGDYFVNEVTVESVRPSSIGDGLLDLTVRCWCPDLVPEAEWPWELIRTGRLIRTGLWRNLQPASRHAWVSVALRAHPFRTTFERPPGTPYELDGRQIVNTASFFCAMGEAVNGPGGYFGSNGDALEDCLRGGWGAAVPFSLTWLGSEVARSHLRGEVADEASLDLLLTILRERGVDVRLA